MSEISYPQFHNVETPGAWVGFCIPILMLHSNEPIKRCTLIVLKLLNLSDSASGLYVYVSFNIF